MLEAGDLRLQRAARLQLCGRVDGVALEQRLGVGSGAL